MDYPKFIVSYQTEELISIQRVKQFYLQLENKASYFSSSVLENCKYKA